jgi:hypothetical protein
LASGFWRWAARDGAAREAYRALWSGVAGWLLGDMRLLGPEVRPTAWVFARGSAVTWRVPAGDGDSLSVRVLRGDSVVTDTVVERGAPLTSGPYPPGTYSFRAERGGEAAGEGRFDVEARTAELAHAVEVPEAPESAAAAAALAGETRPLRTWPWPYLLAIVLLCAEWTLRRRIGLR